MAYYGKGRRTRTLGPQRRSQAQGRKFKKKTKPKYTKMKITKNRKRHG